MNVPGTFAVSRPVGLCDSDDEDLASPSLPIGRGRPIAPAHASSPFVLPGRGKPRVMPSGDSSTSQIGIRTPMRAAKKVAIEIIASKNDEGKQHCVIPGDASDLEDDDTDPPLLSDINTFVDDMFQEFDLVDLDMYIDSFEEEVEVNEEVLGPIEYFRQFFSDSLLDLIVYHTNL